MNMEKKRWLPISGYDENYLVSDSGEILSLRSGTIMRTFDNGNGYLYCTLHKDGMRKNVYVHRIVAESFCEKPLCENDHLVVNHINFVKTDNHAANLEWVTQAENVRYSAANMRKEKKTCKCTSTGEKYIHCKKSGGKIAYRVCIRPKGIDKKFKTLESAIEFRNGVVE